VQIAGWAGGKARAYSHSWLKDLGFDFDNIQR
jgi:hypothetical protein